MRYGEREVITVNLGPEPVKVGGDAKACTVWARGAAPIALRYWVRDGKVHCEDVPTRREAHPVGVVVEVDQADRLLQVGQEGRGQVVVVTGADKEDFRLRPTVRGPLPQALGEVAVGAFGGPEPQFRAQVQQVQASCLAAAQPALDRLLGGQAVVEIENVQSRIYPWQRPSKKPASQVANAGRAGFTG